MSKTYADRKFYCPEFDDRLIKLVRVNPAIYDVNHPNYRRNIMLTTIWERIAAELGASTRFLQTKWKNIRYNYLLELRSQKTGIVNVHIRKRRFKEDLSFLQNTAQSYSTKKSCKISCAASHSTEKDESNMAKKFNLYDDVIEIENSDEDDDGAQDCGSGCTENSNDEITKYADDNYMQPLSPLPTPLMLMSNHSVTTDLSEPSPAIECKTACNGAVNGIKGGLEEDEITIEPISRVKAMPQRHSLPAVELVEKSANRKQALTCPPSQPTATCPNDPIELYCMSLADSFRNMLRSERERVKFEFAKILKDAKYIDDS